MRLQDKPYALFGTCLGAITAYELAFAAVAEGHQPPVSVFTAAVSPPHIYAAAVMRLYLKPEDNTSQAPDVTQVMQTLRTWDQIPKEMLMQVCCDQCCHQCAPQRHFWLPQLRRVPRDAALPSN